ncbi:nuclear transport factor 2 family protein [Acerihabitans sp. TG2]|uniref:nuclear transport factor 2 family protein n=1 Tax=Acerihabitans sp. TG2 TaxID=3096008 RepID=UPI002B22428C|nr:nuclear transport factor 2 family protein [Acerihabitans sp. TG2]MEA9391261.1 nuclear transport factor 2 family protein [Acerihabitans sp. TG2]
MSALTPDPLISAFYQAYNHHDAGSASRLYTDQGWHEEMALGKRNVGQEAIAHGLASLFNLITDVQWTVLSQVACADHRVVFYRMNGMITRTSTDTVPSAGRSATPLVLDGVHLFCVSPAGIENVRDYWNVAHFKQQMA